MKFDLITKIEREGLSGNAMRYSDFESASGNGYEVGNTVGLTRLYL